jgi:hypothetical protein
LFSAGDDVVEIWQRARLDTPWSQAHNTANSMTHHDTIPANPAARPSARLPALLWAWVASWVAFVALVGSFAFSAPLRTDDLSAHVSADHAAFAVAQVPVSVAETDVEAFGIEPALAAFVAVFAVVLRLLAHVGSERLALAPFVHHYRLLTVRWRTRALGSRGPPLHT